MESQGPWFVRVYQRLRLPFWVGILLVGVVPFVTLRLVWLELRGVPLEDIFVTSGGWTILLVAVQYGARHTAKKVAQLGRDVETILQHSSLDLPARGKANIWWLLGFATGIAAVVVLSPGGPSLQLIAEGASIGYVGIFVFTMIEALGSAFSAFSLMAKGGLKLKSFAEDPFLGLKPFGITSLHLLAAYYLFLWGFVLIVPFSLIIGASFGSVWLTLLAPFLGSTLSGAILLIWLLRGLHVQMVQEKRRLIAWVNSIYSSLVVELDSHDRSRLLPALSGIAGLTKLQRDVHKIKEWPLDLRLIVKAITTIFAASGAIATALQLFSTVKGFVLGS